MSLGTFVKRNWLTVVLTVNAIIITWLLTSHYHKKAMAPPKPVFLLDPARTIIIDSKRLSETPLRVVRADGNDIEGDVTSIRFYFWNDSRESIKPANILEPLVITLDDPDCEILDYRILKYSREVVKPIIERNSVDPNKSLSVSFRILEEEDGLTCQIVYKGNPDAGVTISGTIEGTRQITTKATLVRGRYRIDLLIRGFFILLSLIGGTFFMVVIIQDLFSSEESRKSSSFFALSGPDRAENRITCIVLCIILWAVSVGLTIDVIKKAERRAQQKAFTILIEKVPKAIIP